MKLSVYVSASLAYVLGLVDAGTHEVEMPGDETTLGKALSYLAQNWNPKLVGTVIDRDGYNLGRHVVVSVNNLSISLLQGLDTPLRALDQVNLGLYSPSAGG
ncbi:MAG: hypothetical protein HYY01_02710 [Chloroflexi bacterium]|nr:hypothetical protein [Chloroflexota bacterium]